MKNSELKHKIDNGTGFAYNKLAIAEINRRLALDMGLTVNEIINDLEEEIKDETQDGR